MEVFKAKGKQHAREAVRQACRRFVPTSVNFSRSEGKEVTQEVGVRDLNELRQVGLLALSFCL